MKSLNDIIRRILALRRSGQAQITLLATCPNSVAVLEAAVKAAAANNAPMLFAATLNQVDRDGGYTGWTPKKFVAEIHAFAEKYSWDGPLYPCLDHGGPWLKDLHTLNGHSYDETMVEVKHSLTACLEAGYQLLHIDPTVDRTLPPHEPVDIEKVIARTTELISHAEAERRRLGLSPVAYEVGTEEVHGGLVDFNQFTHFLRDLKNNLETNGLMDAWPCFVVAQVGTDLHTTSFDPKTSQRLYDLVSPLGSLVKGHYTDWVENPMDYPATGMGGANVGPEFTAEEFLALQHLSIKEMDLYMHNQEFTPSDFMVTLEREVIESGRWKKWLQIGEQGLNFRDISPERKNWLLQTGARYIWATPSVVNARKKLYENLSPILPDPHAYVVDRIATTIDKYIIAFHLFDSLSIL